MDTISYGKLIGCDIPEMLNPRTLPRQLTDGELAAKRRREARIPAPITATTWAGQNAWGCFALRCLGAPAKGSGRNGFITKGDIAELLA